ncbi:FG-GAP repeat domain-containing protein [Streptomyces sp. NPDC048603]|uniref:FG-GAP repeat domain-containing protein n=1 Tax=Streptomyces sp. NPDC048603 TaxID=3365577 RepID=UPI003711537F
MSSSRSQRPGRIAACTAFALAAGTLLSAGPAFAAGEPAAPKASAAAAAASKQDRTAAGLAGSGAPGKSTFAFKKAKPRLDLDGDGLSDFMFRNHFGATGALQTKTDQVSDYKVSGESTEISRDMIALGNIRGGWGTELLLWHADGRLAMHQAYGTGTQAATWTGTGWQIYNKLIAAGDLTKDGRGDLLARTPSGDLYLYRATGSATGNPFGGRVKVGGGWGAYDQVIGANDLDADGIADLLAKDLGGNLWYYKGTGSTTAPFKGRVKVGGGWNIYNKIVAMDDQSGDGKADIYGVQHNGELYGYASLGGGKFGARQKLGGGWTIDDAIVNSGVTPVFGKHSVTAVTGANEVREYVNRADGLFFSPPVAYDFPWNSGRTLVNATGLDRSNQATKLSWTGSALFNSVTGNSVGTLPNTNLVVGPGDLNGDGKGDLLSRDTWGNLLLNPGNGTGGWFGKPVLVGPGWNAYKTLAGGGDINGDGRADLVAQSHDGHLYLYKGTGNASAPFGAREWYSGGWNGYSGIAVAGDLTGDGRADLVARDYNGDMWLYRGTGNGGTGAFAGRTHLDKGWKAFAQFN